MHTKESILRDIKEYEGIVKKCHVVLSDIKSTISKLNKTRQAGYISICQDSKNGYIDHLESYNKRLRRQRDTLLKLHTPRQTINRSNIST